MYEKFFGLRCHPFALTPDPEFLFRSRQHGMALTLMEYGLESRAMFALLTGAVGTGKTTLLRHLLRNLRKDISVGLISNTHSGFDSIHPWAISAFSVVPADCSEISLYEALVSFFVDQYRRGKRSLLIVDEAQNLPMQVLEQLRLLSNVNSDGDLVLQILLVGQPELRQTLQRPELLQLAQRISADFHLTAMSQAETSAYVEHRLRASGSRDGLFTRDALELVHVHSGGVPRLINQLCDMSMVYGYAVKQSIIDADLVREVLVDRQAAGALQLFAGVENIAPVVELRAVG
ncbi:MAG: AAA family ATPase [Pseudomonadota bacterium]